MEEAARSRRASREAIRDVAPDALRERMESILEEGSAIPGTVTILTASAVAEDGATDEAVDRCAAGVQLIYDGLRVIRDLTRENPWADLPDDAGDVDADLTVLAADVLVARGFYLLARTDAAGKAVETVRSFGRDRTLADPDADPEPDLEVDALELAVIAGAAVADAAPTAALLEEAVALARSGGVPLGSVEGTLPEADFEPGTDVRTTTDGTPRTSAGDP